MRRTLTGLMVVVAVGLEGPELSWWPWEGSDGFTELVQWNGGVLADWMRQGGVGTAKARLWFLWLSGRNREVRRKKGS